MTLFSLNWVFQLDYLHPEWSTLSKRCSHLSSQPDWFDVFHRWTSLVPPPCSRTGQHLPHSSWEWSARHPLHPGGPVTGTYWRLWLPRAPDNRLSRWARFRSRTLVSDLDSSMQPAFVGMHHRYMAEWRFDRRNHQLDDCCIHWLRVQRRLLTDISCELSMHQPFQMFGLADSLQEKLSLRTEIVDWKTQISVLKSLLNQIKS